MKEIKGYTPQDFLKENKKVILNGAYVGDFIEAEAFTLYSMPLYEENIKLRQELDSMHLNMQYYMEYCKANGYVTPMEWIEKHKHF